MPILLDLANELNIDPHEIKMGKDFSFYAVTDNEVESSLFKCERKGLFLNFYPTDDFYKKSIKEWQNIKTDKKGGKSLNGFKEELPIEPDIFFFGAYTFARNAKGEGLTLNDTAKELLINMEELYIDEKRSVFKGNYDKIMKKMIKCEKLYRKYYYEVKEKSEVTKAYLGFLGYAFSLLDFDVKGVRL